MKTAYHLDRFLSAQEPPRTLICFRKIFICDIFLQKWVLSRTGNVI